MVINIIVLERSLQSTRTQFREMLRNQERKRPNDYYRLLNFEVCALAYSLPLVPPKMPPPVRGTGEEGDRLEVSSRF